MSDSLQNFVFLFGVCAILAWILNIPAMRGIRRKLDKRVNASSDELGKMLKASEVGTTVKASQGLGSTVHETSLGIRVITIALVIACTIVSQFYGMGPAEGILIFAALSYHAYYIWSYKIELTSDALYYPTYFMSRKSISLHEITEMESDGAYTLRLFNQEKRTTEILAYLTGKHELEKRLQSIIANNTLRAQPQ